MKHIVVDLEMNCLAKEYKEEKQICCMETIEIGCIARYMIAKIHSVFPFGLLFIRCPGAFAGQWIN